MSIHYHMLETLCKPLMFKKKEIASLRFGSYLANILIKERDKFCFPSLNIVT